MDAVFGFIMYGIADPWSQSSAAPVLYTNAVLPSTGLPSELTGCTQLPIVKGLPGINWGADPRHPTGNEEVATITLLDDALGTLGTLFLADTEAGKWGVETNRLSAGGTTAKFADLPSPADDSILYLGNEALLVHFTSTPTLSHGTTNCTLTRARCGSTARAHVLRPTDYSAGEDGSEDRLYLRQKPDWEEGFLCGVYLFRLDSLGNIAGYILRRGVVTEEPSPDYPFYQVKIKLLADALNAHQVGEQSKEITITAAILVHALESIRPKEVSFLLTRPEAERFFNEPVGPRSSSVISAAMVADLNTRLLADPAITWEVKLVNDFEWVYKITQVATYTFHASGVAYQRVRVKGTLQPGGFTSGASCLTTASGGLLHSNQTLRFRAWYQDSSPTFAITNGSYDTTGPTISLRLKMRKTVCQAFLILAISRDGSTGGTYDKLIGGFGAGLPEAYFNTGATVPNPLLISSVIAEILQLDQLLDAHNVYYFDLTKGVSLKDFLTNEFISTQVLLGSLQSGLLTLKTWLHEVASTVTLNPITTERAKAGERLSAVKRLDLSAGTNVLTLEPVDKRSVRYGGTTRIKSEEIQPLRFWRSGLHLLPTDITSGDLAQLVRAFNRVFGGAPRVYEVSISIEQYMDDVIEFADAVAWSDASIPTPTGLGIDDDFFIIGVDLNYDDGLVRLKLLQNTLLVAPVPTTTGALAPSINVTGITSVSPTVADVDVEYVGGAAIDLFGDFDGLWTNIESLGGKIKIDNHRQAPVGELERQGSVEAHATIEILSSNQLRLTVDSSYLRGDYTSLSDMLHQHETKLTLPARVTEEASLDGSLIEPDFAAGPSVSNFLTMQPSSPKGGVAYTFR